jgi:tagaturonate reductase
MILQFGAGNFLRAFVDLFAAQLNRDPGTAVGQVVVVQSTGTGRADVLNARGCRYHVAIQGYENSGIIDRIERVDSISRVLPAATHWNEVLAISRDPNLRIIVSNTTESGFALHDGDTRIDEPPRSFPAKLLTCLLQRHSTGAGPLTIIPCELVERNGERLLGLVMEQAARWGIDGPVLAWIRDGCHWINNLVDRIVPGTPKSHPLLAEDPLLLSAEPYALWAVETTAPFLFHHPAVVTAPDITPYYLRKVRILNGLHSALVCYALPLGIQTVREAVEHPEVGPWLENLLFEEIVPLLEGRVEDPAGFGRVTLDRFRNPFLDHQLSSIALNHDDKVRVRLLPSYEEYRSKFGRSPRLLGAALEAAGFNPPTDQTHLTTRP